jgi:hypothetical protein
MQMIDANPYTELSSLLGFPKWQTAAAWIGQAPWMPASYAGIFLSRLPLPLTVTTINCLLINGQLCVGIMEKHWLPIQTQPFLPGRSDEPDHLFAKD